MTKKQGIPQFTLPAGPLTEQPFATGVLSGLLRRRSLRCQILQRRPVTRHQAVEQLRGVFPSDATLRAAISHLTHAGFDRDRMMLPNPAATIAGVAGADASRESPKTESEERQLRTLHSSTAAAAAAMVGAGVVIATGGAAAAAVAAAAGAGLAAGGGMPRGDENRRCRRRRCPRRSRRRRGPADPRRLDDRPRGAGRGGSSHAASRRHGDCPGAARGRKDCRAQRRRPIRKARQIYL